MPANTYVYNLENIAVSFLGLNIEGGFGEGGAIKITPDGPKYVVKKGVDGSVTRCATGDKLYQVELTFGQQSDANTLLAGVLLASLLAPNGGGIGTLFIQDLNGALFLSSPAAFVEGDPEAELKGESTDRVWKLYACQADFFAGGSFSVVGAV